MASTATGSPVAPPLQCQGRAAAAAPGAGVVAAGLLLFGGVWLLVLAAGALSPPLDNIEQLVWMRSLEGGYYKHPPLPTWLLWPVVQAVGWNAWATYLLGAACTLAAVALHWHLTARLNGHRAAAVALLAVLGIAYYNGRLNYYNHNIVLLLAVVAAAYANWQLLATGQRRWWAALGLAMGLGAMSKYQVAVAVLPLLATVLHRRAWRHAVHRQGLGLALAIAAACLAPHFAWLLRHDFAPVGYAMETSLGVQLGAAARSALALQWLADQVLNRALPALLVLVLVAWPLWRAGPAPAKVSPPLWRDAAAVFQLAWGLLPLAGITVLGMSSGAELQLQWGTAFLLFLVPACMVLATRCWRIDWTQASLRRALLAAALLQALLLVLNVATSPRGPQALVKHHWRSFDSAGLARVLGAPARAELGGAIRIVAGDTPRAGALALQLAEHPLVLIDERLDRSPWLDVAAVRHCGVLHLGDAGKLPAGRAVGEAFGGLAWAVTPRDTSAPCALDR